MDESAVNFEDQPTMDNEPTTEDPVLPEEVQKIKDKGVAIFALVDIESEELLYFKKPSKGMVYTSINKASNKKGAQALEQLLLDCAILPDRVALEKEFSRNPMTMGALLPKFQEACGGAREFEVKKF